MGRDGSLAYGDVDDASDIDVILTAGGEVSGPMFERLRTMQVAVPAPGVLNVTMHLHGQRACEDQAIE